MLLRAPLLTAALCFLLAGLAFGEDPPAPGGTYTELKTEQPRWLTKLDEARLLAAQQEKQILFLVTGNMQICPAGARFNRLISTGTSFPHLMSADYILLLLDLSSLGNSPSEKEFLQIKEVLDLRETVFKGITIPALAILSADTKSWTIVDIEKATGIDGYDNMLDVTVQAIKAAEKKPLKKSGMSFEALKRPRIIMAAIIGIGALIFLKRLFS